MQHYGNHKSPDSKTVAVTLPGPVSSLYRERDGRAAGQRGPHCTNLHTRYSVLGLLNIVHLCQMGEVSRKECLARGGAGRGGAASPHRTCHCTQSRTIRHRHRYLYSTNTALLSTAAQLVVPSPGRTSFSLHPPSHF